MFLFHERIKLASIEFAASLQQIDLMIFTPFVVNGLFHYKGPGFDTGYFSILNSLIKLFISIKLIDHFDVYMTLNRDKYLNRKNYFYMS